MTAATYDFNLSTVQSSASSMIVELQPDTTSATPGTDGRWQGGVRPRITLNWAAGVKLAQGTVNTAGNTTVDGNAVYKWVKISSTPSDLTLDISSLPTVTIVDDDASGGTGYGPATVQDTGSQNTGSTAHIATFDFVPSKLRAIWYLGLDAAGQNAYAAIEQVSGGDNFVRLGRYTDGALTFDANQTRQINPTANAPLAMRLNADGSIDALSDGVRKDGWAIAGATDRPMGGTRARIVSTTAGATLLNARINSL